MPVVDIRTVERYNIVDLALEAFSYRLDSENFEQLANVICCRSYAANIRLAKDLDESCPISFKNPVRGRGELAFSVYHNFLF